MTKKGNPNSNKPVIIFVITVSVLAILATLTFAYAQVEVIPVLDADLTKEQLEEKKTEYVESLDEFDIKIADKRDEVREKVIYIRDLQEQIPIIKAQFSTSYTAQSDLVLLDGYILSNQTALTELRQDFKNLKSEKKFTEQLILDTDHRILVIQSEEFDKLHVDYSKLYKLIGIQLSESCITLLTNNFTTTCPDYEELSQLDNSLHQYSGNFTTTDGFFHRMDAPYKESWRYYDQDILLRIIVDPPHGMADRIRTIEITPNFDTYFLRDNKLQLDEYNVTDVEIFNIYTQENQTHQVINKTSDFARIIYHDRYVDDCRKATINSEKWLSLVPDTIRFMRNDCHPDFTTFVDKEVIYDPKSEFSFMDSRQYAHDQWIKDVLENCIFEYGKC